jgi:isopenicillin N synthase-like dioxygenase
VKTLDALEAFFALPTEQKLEASWHKTPEARGYESFEDMATNEGNNAESNGLLNPITF